MTIFHRLIEYIFIGKLPLNIALSELNLGVNTLEIVLSDAAGDIDTYRTNITVERGALCISYYMDSSVTWQILAQ